jgi:hypothetical protein
MTFDLFINFVKNKVEENYKRDGFIAPVFLAVLEGKKLDAVPLNELSHLGKERMSNVLRMYCEGEKPLYTAHIAEANLLVSNKDDLEKIINNPLLNPSVHPDRIDIVSISLCSKNGGRRHVVYRTINNGLEIPRLEPLNETEGSDSDGLFANLI